MEKKPNPMTIAVIIFAVLLITVTAIRLTGMGNSFPNPIRNGMSRILAPVEQVIWNVGDGIKDNLRAIFRFRTVEAENEMLRNQVEELKGYNLQLKEKILTAMRLEDLDEGSFDSPTLDKYKKIGASIINRNPTAWYQTISVNKGSSDGVKINDPVVANMGLVGKVVSVTPTTSDVLLILDGEGQVGALVRDNKGKAVFGILNGTYNRKSRLTATGTLEMDFKQEDEVNEGDIVYTSGLGGVYPKDIPIGIVQTINLDATGLLKTAFIKPLVNFDSLEEVYLVDMSGGN